ncbi:MAG: hypothetical protein HGA79_04305, partial [Anaerolineales bacterium]|nr:hypothetical protein [Anaerolineales bacterium]
IMGSLPRGAVKHSFKPSFKTFTRLPWMTWFMIDKWSFGSKMRRALPKLKERVKATPYLDLDQWSESDLLAAVDRHYELMREAAYYNVMGPMLMGMYNNMLKSQLGKQGVEFTNFNLTEGMTEIAEYDPATHLRRLHAQFCALPPEAQEKMRSVSYAEFQRMTEVGDFPQQVAQLIEEFGHLSDNGNDFSAVPWREQPEIVLQLVTDFVPKKEEGKKVPLSDLRASGMLKFFYKRAREFRLLREQVSGLYTHGYGLFRYYFLALGRHFVRRGLIETPEDIFFLTFSQVRDLVNGKQTIEDLRGEIAHHKADMDHYKDILIPTVIYGDEIPPVREPNMDVMSGIATSIGHYTGKVKVVRGIQDFQKVKHGDVLVIPYSDVGWTPLFARAGAVVAESGGLLSHSSIVAREYNIPAVVSVEGATLLPDETTVTVDGHKGEVLIHK